MRHVFQIYLFVTWLPFLQLSQQSNTLFFCYLWLFFIEFCRASKRVINLFAVWQDLTVTDCFLVFCLAACFGGDRQTIRGVWLRRYQVLVFIRVRFLLSETRSRRLTGILLVFIVAHFVNCSFVGSGQACITEAPKTFASALICVKFFLSWQIGRILEDLYEAHGDTLALQYGGSQLVHGYALN